MRLESLFQDVRFGAKLLFKEKGFTITALLTLALCIGANTAIFTVVNSVLLRPLPFPDSGRLVALYNSYPGVGVEKGSNATPDYLDRRKLTEVFEGVALIGFSGYDIGMAGSAEHVLGQYVTPSFFHVLRAQPILGRAFTEQEAVLGNENVVLLSYGLWKQMFAGSPSALGRDIRLSGKIYKIVGVMPEDFTLYSNETKLWVPFALTPQQTSDDARHSNSWQMVARLKPGVSIAQAQQRINALNKYNLERFPVFRKILEEARFHTKVEGLLDSFVEDVKPTLFLLQAAVAFVLLIGCVNVANLMLVRSNVRMKELSIRASLGAGRWRLARQLLTESVLLSTLGGALGTGIGFAGVKLLTYLGSEALPRAEGIRMDAPVLGFTLAIAIVTGLVFGSVPVIHLFKRDLNAVYRQTERGGTAERGALATRAALVVCQVSLAFVLLIGAGLMTLSFLRVLAIDPGFKPQNVMTASLSLPQVRYGQDPQVSSFLERLLETTRHLPGVESAGLTTYLPFSGNNNASVITIVGYNRAPGEPPPVPGYNTVDTGYFRTMGIPLLRGRTFEETDTLQSQGAVIIDQFLAQRYWPKRNPLGEKIRQGIDNSDPVLTIVGVVGTVKTSDLADRNPVGQVYFHYKQRPRRDLHLVMKTGGQDAAAVNAVRGELRRLDPELPLFDAKTMPARLAASMMNRKAPMVLCLVFAGLALVLAAVGIYGVLAYTVTQRTREFGIRMAMGAEASDVLRLVFRQGLKLAVTGLAAGILGAFFLTRLMTSLLYDVKPADPGVFVLVSCVLAAVAVVASLIPSLRATRINPVSALRYE